MYVNVPQQRVRGFRGFGASAPAVLALQEQINVSLPSDSQIAEDGIIGPATCAAAVQTMDAATYGPYCNSNGSVKSAAVTTSSTVKPTTSVAPATSSKSGTILGLPTNTVILIALGSVGFMIFMGGKKTKG